jgi:hypothetical protein
MTKFLRITAHTGNFRTSEHDSATPAKVLNQLLISYHNQPNAKLYMTTKLTKGTMSNKISHGFLPSFCTILIKAASKKSRATKLTSGINSPITHQGDCSPSLYIIQLLRIGIQANQAFWDPNF